MGFWFGRHNGISLGILTEVDKLIEDGYIKTRTQPNGDLDLIKLTLEEKIDAPETTDS